MNTALATPILHSPSLRRRVLAIVAVLSIAFTGLTWHDAQAGANPNDEAAFVSALNATRAAVGLPALTVDSELTVLSRGWAQSMANAGQISHANPISAGVTAPWLKLGENVGVGPDVQSIMDAFIASPGHYANIVDPEFTRVGVGVVWDGNALYTTHRFMRVEETSTPDPEPVTPPTTTSAPTTPAAPPADDPLGVPTEPTPPAAEPERVAIILNRLLRFDL